MTLLFCSLSISFFLETCALAVATLCIPVVCFLGSRKHPISYKLQEGIDRFIAVFWSYRFFQDGSVSPSF